MPLLPGYPEGGVRIEDIPITRTRELALNQASMWEILCGYVVGGVHLLCEKVTSARQLDSKAREWRIHQGASPPLANRGPNGEDVRRPLGSRTKNNVWRQFRNSRKWRRMERKCELSLTMTGRQTNQSTSDRIYNTQWGLERKCGPTSIIKMKIV